MVFVSPGFVMEAFITIFENDNYMGRYVSLEDSGGETKAEKNLKPENLKWK